MVGDVPAPPIFIGVEERPAAGETVFDAMPVAHTLLAVAPAEKDDLSSQHAGKIHHPLLHAFTDTAVTVDLFHQALYLMDQTRNGVIFLQPLHQIRAVGGKLSSADPRLAFLAQKFQVVENLLYQRPQRRKEVVGLVDGKETGADLSGGHRLPTFQGGHHRPMPFLISRSRAMLSE